MSLYTERDPVKLREIAVALCVETAKRSSTHTSAQLTRVAEATVPPVPVKEAVAFKDVNWALYHAMNAAFQEVGQSPMSHASPMWEAIMRHVAPFLVNRPIEEWIASAGVALDTWYRVEASVRLDDRGTVLASNLALHVHASPVPTPGAAHE